MHCRLCSLFNDYSSFEVGSPKLLRYDNQHESLYDGDSAVLLDQGTRANVRNSSYDWLLRRYIAFKCSFFVFELACYTIDAIHNWNSFDCSERFFRSYHICCHQQAETSALPHHNILSVADNGIRVNFNDANPVRSRREEALRKHKNIIVVYDAWSVNRKLLRSESDDKI